MPGHVFVIHGDLTKLHCDAWLVPTDAGLNVSSGWTKSSDELRTWVDRLRDDPAARPNGWGNDGVRVIPFENWPDTSTQPRPYLVNVGGVPGLDKDWYMKGARQFFQAIADHQSSHRKDFQHDTPEKEAKRAKPLVALPLVGTGQGGAHDIKGEIIRVLLDELYAAAKKYDFDIILVANNAPALAAAQAIRRRYLNEHGMASVPDPWPDLTPRLRDEAKKLADHANRGELVLFIGAGVSKGAGLPGWGQLLAGLAKDAQMKDKEREALKALDDVDKARIIANRLKRVQKVLGQAVSDCLRADRYSLTHGLLAALPISEVVTTNYDRLFEEASIAVGKRTAVLPYEPVGDDGRWLLKMHGCVDHPEDIVLTREDYLRYTDKRAALAGIVQALLMTRHMLFVGYSLRDHTFQQLVDDVHKALYGTDHKDEAADKNNKRTDKTNSEHAAHQRQGFGTTLLLRKDEFLEELWQRDLYFVSVSEDSGQTTRDDERLVEIFLDYLLAEATRGAAHLLDDAYEAVLTDDEKAIKKLLQVLNESATEAIRQSPGWRPVADLLHKLGEPRVSHESNQTLQ